MLNKSLLLFLKHFEVPRPLFFLASVPDCLVRPLAGKVHTELVVLSSGFMALEVWPPTKVTGPRSQVSSSLAGEISGLSIPSVIGS